MKIAEAVIKHRGITLVQYEGNCIVCLERRLKSIFKLLVKLSHVMMFTYDS